MSTKQPNSAPILLGICGPNGSGKSTAYKTLVASGQLEKLPWINADDLLRKLQRAETVSLNDFGLTLGDVIDFNQLVEHDSLTTSLRSQGDTISLYANESGDLVIDDRATAYEAAIATSVLRSMLIEKKLSLAFETVMSHISKVQLFEKALAAGFETQLIFVCTNDPKINVDRVAMRVRQGGHDVTESKIRARYVRSLELLPLAAAACSKVTLLDTTNIPRVIATKKYDTWKSYPPVPSWAKAKFSI